VNLSLWGQSLPPAAPVMGKTCHCIAVTTASLKTAWGQNSSLYVVPQKGRAGIRKTQGLWSDEQRLVVLDHYINIYFKQPFKGTTQPNQRKSQSQMGHWAGSRHSSQSTRKALVSYVLLVHDMTSHRFGGIETWWSGKRTAPFRAGLLNFVWRIHPVS